jgi:hypothetical protein
VTSPDGGTVHCGDVTGAPGHTSQCNLLTLGLQGEGRLEREIARLQVAAAADLERIRREANEASERELRGMRELRDAAQVGGKGGRGRGGWVQILPWQVDLCVWEDRVQGAWVAEWP